MKRFIGWILAIAGVAGALWGGVSLLTGSLRTEIRLGPDFAVNAMTGGLVGVALLTVGLVWVRD